MRRFTTALCLLAAISLLGACASAKRDTGFPTPSPSVSTASESPVEKPTPPAQTITSTTVTAKAYVFAPGVLYLKADTADTLTFDNQDSDRHNVHISADAGFSGTAILAGAIVQGPSKKDYPIPPTPAGDYFFRCDVHPGMKGTISFA